MPVKLKTPIKKVYTLDYSDKELGVEDGATTVTIRQARQGDFELRASLNTDFERRFDGNQISVHQKISPDETRRMEVYLTLVDSNIVGPDGRPLFQFENGRVASEAAFDAAWNQLEPFMAEEIHLKVLDMNPLWNTFGVPTDMPTDGKVDEEAVEELLEGQSEPKSGEDG